MNKDNQSITISLEPVEFALSNSIIAFDEEIFRLVAVSGNQGRQYVLTPKHAKRLLMLLQARMNEFEGVFGKIETSLPQATPDQSSEKKVGFGA